MVEGEKRKEYNSHNHDITENVREIENQAKKHSKVHNPHHRFQFVLTFHSFILSSNPLPRALDIVPLLPHMYA